MVETMIKKFAKRSEEVKIPEDITDEEEISDYISNETGFCHYGFEFRE